MTRRGDGNVEAPAGDVPTGRGRRAAAIARRWGPLAVLAAGAAAFTLSGAAEYMSFETLSRNHEWLTGIVEANSAAAAAAFVSAYALMTAFSIPGGAFMTMLGGFLFGVGPGTAYVVAGATAGAVVVFLAARTALADVVRRRAGRAVSAMRDGFAENPLGYMLFLRLVPVFPFWLVNIVPAFLGVRLRIYVLGTAAGIAPGAAVFASVGNGMGAVLERGGRPDASVLADPAVFGPIAALAVLSLVPTAYRRVRARRAGRSGAGEA